MSDKDNDGPKGFWLDDWAKFMPVYFDTDSEDRIFLMSAIKAIQAQCARLDLPMALYICVQQSGEGCQVFTAHSVPEDLGRVPSDMLLRLPSNHEGADLVRHQVEVLKAAEVRLTLIERADLIARLATKQ